MNMQVVIVAVAHTHSPSLLITLAQCYPNMVEDHLALYVEKYKRFIMFISCGT